MIRILYLSTLLEAQSDFGPWTGYTLYTVPQITSVFEGTIGSGIHTNLELSDLFYYQINATRTLITQETINDSFSGYVLNVHSLNTPIESPDEIPEEEPTADLPSPKPFQNAGKKAPINFQIYRSGQLVWLANAPEFGDTNEYKHNRELIRNRGNDLIDIDIITWGRDDIFEYTFNWLNNSQKQLFLTMLRNLLGKKVTIIDHLGYSRLGWILNPDSEVAENTPKGFTATLRFQVNA